MLDALDAASNRNAADLDLSSLPRHPLRRRDPLAHAEARAGRPAARRAPRRRLRRVGDRRAGPVGHRRGRRRSRPRRASASTTRPTVLGDDLRPRRRPASSACSRVAATSRSATTRTRRRPRPRSRSSTACAGRCPATTPSIEDDGTITLLGRGSVSINTGGEKVYPEEVESALKSLDAVFDAVVVGVPDERFGERVVAVVQARPRRRADARRHPGAPARAARGLQGAARRRAGRRDRALAVGQARLPLGPGHRHRRPRPSRRTSRP